MTSIPTLDREAPASSPSGPPAGPPPHAVLAQLATGAYVSRCLHVVAELGVADEIGPDGADVHHVARAVGADADTLGRMLRALAGVGVFAVDLPTIRHNDVSQLLRKDHPMSMGAFAHMMGLPLSWEAIGRLPETARTGRAGMLALDPDGFFSYLSNHPDQRDVFDAAMASKSWADIACILDAYDFGALGSVADVGGGRGHLLQAIVDRHPSIEASLVELPEVITQLSNAATTRDLQLVAADFFTDDLPSADAYVLMEIIHDWDDHDAVRILSNIRRSAPPNAVILLVESVLSDRPGPDPAKTLDVVMLAVTGGRQRSGPEFATLLAEAGFTQTEVIPTTGAVQIVKASL